MRSTGKPRCFTPSFRLLAITQLIDCAGRQPQPARSLAPLFVRYFIQYARRAALRHQGFCVLAIDIAGDLDVDNECGDVDYCSGRGGRYSVRP